MLKHLYFLGAAVNSLVLYWYIADDHLPQKFNIIAWGCFTVIMLFLEALKAYYIEKSKVMVQREFDEKISPIMNNKNLTDKEKQDKINEFLAEKLVNRIAKNANIQIKEKDDE